MMKRGTNVRAPYDLRAGGTQAKDGDKQSLKRENPEDDEDERQSERQTAATG